MHKALTKQYLLVQAGKGREIEFVSHTSCILEPTIQEGNPSAEVIEIWCVHDQNLVEIS